MVGKGRSRVHKGMQVSRLPLHTYHWSTKLPYVVVRGITKERFCDFDCINSTNIM